MQCKVYTHSSVVRRTDFRTHDHDDVVFGQRNAKRETSPAPLHSENGRVRVLMMLMRVCGLRRVGSPGLGFRDCGAEVRIFYAGCVYVFVAFGEVAADVLDGFDSGI